MDTGVSPGQKSGVDTYGKRPRAEFEWGPGTEPLIKESRDESIP